MIVLNENYALKNLVQALNKGTESIYLNSLRVREKKKKNFNTVNVLVYGQITRMQRNSKQIVS